LGNLAASAGASVHISSTTTRFSCGIYVNNASVGATNAIWTPASAQTAVTCACNVTGDQATSILDIQRAINEALGAAQPVNDLNQDGLVNAADVQLVINSALHLGCS
jgi:hypothetical protein